MNGPVYRLYLTEYERCPAWMSGGTSAFLKYVEPYDMYSVYITGRSKLPPDHYRDTLKKLGDQCEIIDATQMPDRDLYAHMLGQINKYATNDTYVFFIGSDEDFNALKGKTSQWKSFSRLATYRSGRIALPPGARAADGEVEEKTDRMNKDRHGPEDATDRNHKDSGTDPPKASAPAPDNTKEKGKKKPRTGNKKRRGPEQGGSTLDAEMMGLFLGNINSIHIGDQHSVVDKPQPIGRDPSETLPKEEPASSAPEPGKGSAPAREREEDSCGKSDRKEKGEGRGQRRPKQDHATWRQRISPEAATKGSAADASWTQQQLEKAIFGTEQEHRKTEKTYTELDDSKAKTVSLLAERLIGNINKLVRGIRDYGFQYEDYMELVSTLVKSNSLSDFREGWATVHPGCELNLDEETYGMLYKEAMYYAKACDVLYGEDRW